MPGELKVLVGLLFAIDQSLQLSSFPARKVVVLVAWHLYFESLIDEVLSMYYPFWMFSTMENHGLWKLRKRLMYFNHWTLPYSGILSFFDTLCVSLIIGYARNRTSSSRVECHEPSPLNLKHVISFLLDEQSASRVSLLLYPGSLVIYTLVAPEHIIPLSFYP